MDTHLKALLVGCGSISRVWVTPAHDIPNFELVGFVDINVEAAQKRAEQYGKPDVYVGSDLEAALAQTLPDIVFDCTFPSARTRIVLTALAHDCHVFSEKPMAESMEDARKMIDAAEQAGKLYAVMQNRRYDTNINSVKLLVDSGTLGALTVVNSDFYLGAHFGGSREQLPHVLLHDMAIHTFDAARFLSGANAVSVYCKEWNPRGSWYSRDAAAVAVFELNNGAVYTYRGSWCAEGLLTTWESDWRLVGQKGTVKWDGAQDIQAQVVEKTEALVSTFANVPIPAEASTWGEGHSAAIRDFIDCVRTGRTPQTICTDNIKSLAMVFAAIRSAEAGCEVKVEW